MHKHCSPCAGHHSKTRWLPTTVPPLLSEVGLVVAHTAPCWLSRRPVTGFVRRVRPLCWSRGDATSLSAHTSGLAANHLASCSTHHVLGPAPLPGQHTLRGSWKPRVNTLHRLHTRPGSALLLSPLPADHHACVTPGVDHTQPLSFRVTAC